MRLLLRCGRLFDGDALHDGALVEIDDDRIVRVRPVGSVSDDRSDGRTEVDLRDLTVLPGLIDAHTHLVGGDVVAGAASYAESRRLDEPEGLQAFRTLEAAQRTLRAGITTVREMSGRDFLDVQLARAVDEGLVRGPTVIPSGLGLTITGGHVHRRCVEVDSPDEVRKEVRRHIKYGARWIKLMGVTGGMSTVGRDPLAPQFTIDEIRAGVDEAHRAGARVAVHAHGSEGIANAIEAGVDTIEHGTYLTDALAEAMAEKGIALVPTLMNEMKYREALERGEVGDAVIRQRRKLADEGRPVPTPEDRIAIALRHGVTIIAGTDCGGNALCRHGDNVQELLMLVATGLSPVDALRAATGVAADTLNLPEHGRIREGCRADLVLCHGDATADTGVLATEGGIAGVIKNGELAFTPSKGGTWSSLGS